MELEEFLEQWHNDQPTIEVQTSGSTGRPKKMLVEKRRMEASARITCQFLGLHEGDTALLCMPLDYIAGKMMVVRALTCNLQLVSLKPTSHPMKDLAEVPTFAAMVPMQVYNSLLVPEERERLQQIKHLIIGGGAIDDAMAKELKTFPNAVWSTYGMTETLSHIALRRLSGSEATEWYTPFSGVALALSSEGCLVIDAPEVAEKTIRTHDLAEIKNGRFRILGRTDNAISTGGVKVLAEEIEQKLRKHLRVPYLITKRKNDRFGEVVVMLVETKCVGWVKDICQARLPEFWRPRVYIPVDHIPLTETGKPARKKAEKMAAAPK